MSHIWKHWNRPITRHEILIPVPQEKINAYWTLIHVDNEFHDERPMGYSNTISTITPCCCQDYPCCPVYSIQQYHYWPTTEQPAAQILVKMHYMELNQGHFSMQPAYQRIKHRVYLYLKISYSTYNRQWKTTH